MGWKSIVLNKKRCLPLQSWALGNYISLPLWYVFSLKVLEGSRSSQQSPCHLFAPSCPLRCAGTSALGRVDDQLERRRLIPENQYCLEGSASAWGTSCTQSCWKRRCTRIQGDQVIEVPDRVPFLWRGLAVLPLPEVSEGFFLRGQQSRNGRCPRTESTCRTQFYGRRKYAIIKQNPN